jgi:hypothetical protein
MRALVGAAVFGVLAAMTAPLAHAQALDAALRRDTVEKAAAAMRNEYVFPEPGARAAEKIEALLAGGAYDAITDAGAFAQRLTTDLREATSDRHLRITAQGVAAPAPAPAAGAAPPAPPPRSEAGFVRADRLAGGIAYVEVVGFPDPASFRIAADRAMASVADAPSLIIDVRRNTGGSPEAVAYLESFFVANEPPVKLLDFQRRIPGQAGYETNPMMSSATPTKFLGRPVLILTSGRTFSGGEGFAYNMQAMGHAKTVGEVTGGGAHPTYGRPLNARFGIGIPTTRPVSPITHTDWEGVGVRPDVATTAADALKVAMERLGQTVTSGEINALSQASLFQPRNAEQPGTAAAVRRTIAELQLGEPDYNLQTAAMGETTRRQLPQLKALMENIGAVESVTFDGPGPRGGDAFRVRTTYALVFFAVAVDADGKLASANFRFDPASEEQRQAAFTASDANHDGKLDRTEYLAVLQKMGFANQIDTLFPQRDADHDGFVTAAEYRTAVQ